MRREFKKGERGGRRGGETDMRRQEEEPQGQGGQRREGGGRRRKDIVNSSVHDIKLLYEDMDWISLGTALGYATESIKGKPGVLEGNDITVNQNQDYTGTTGNGHCAGAARAAGITQNPENVTFTKAEIAGKPEVTRSENKTGNVNIIEYVTKDKEAWEDNDLRWKVRY